MGHLITVIRKITSSEDGSDIREHLTTLTHPWRVQTSLLSLENSDAYHIRQDQVSLVNPDQQLQFPIGRMRELARHEDGTWQTEFFPNLEQVPEGVHIEIETKSRTRKSNPRR